MMQINSIECQHKCIHIHNITYLTSFSTIKLTDSHTLSYYRRCESGIKCNCISRPNKIIQTQSECSFFGIKIKKKSFPVISKIEVICSIQAPQPKASQPNRIINMYVGICIICYVV